MLQLNARHKHVINPMIQSYFNNVTLVFSPQFVTWIAKNRKRSEMKIALCYMLIRWYICNVWLTIKCATTSHTHKRHSYISEVLPWVQYCAFPLQSSRPNNEIFEAVDIWRRERLPADRAGLRSAIWPSVNSMYLCHSIDTRKRALHARMSHSTVCYTTVCTKKTLRILVK